MTDIRASSPVHLHLPDKMPVHVHIDHLGGRKSRPSARAVDDYCAPKINSRTNSLGRRSFTPPTKLRSSSPTASAPWVPPPARTSKGSRNASPGNITWTAEEVELSQTGQYERKMQSLMNEIDQLKCQMELERRGDLIQASKDLLNSKQQELENLKCEAAEKETRALRASLEALGVDPAEDPELELMRRLIETELASQSAGRNARRMIEWLPDLVMKDGRDLAGKSGMSQRNELLQRLKEYDQCSRGLRTLLRERQEGAGVRATQEMLLSRIKQLQEDNGRLKSLLEEKDKSIKEMEKELNQQRDKSLVNASIQETLETTKAHLQNQLRQKEGDNNRYAVQVRTLESEISQLKLEMEHLSEQLRQSQERSDGDHDQLKKATRAHKQRAVKLEEQIEEMKAQLAEKDCHIKSIQNELDETRTSSQRWRDDQERVQYESQELRNRLTEMEDRLCQAERTTVNQSRDFQTQEAILMENNDENARLRDVASSCNARLSEADKELNGLRSSLEQYETLLSEYRSQTENHSSKLASLYDRIQAVEEERRKQQSRGDDAERRLRDIELQNRDLLNSLSKKEENMANIQTKLDEKSRENAALLRQLESALTETKRQNEIMREKDMAKERKLQSRIHDVEAQLAQTKAELARANREKDEIERRQASRIQDMKAQLEQSSLTNRSMQTYVHFLKKSYANVFGSELGNGLSLNPTGSLSNLARRSPSP